MLILLQDKVAISVGLDTSEEEVEALGTLIELPCPWAGRA